MVIFNKSLVRVTSVFRTCYSPDFEEADFYRPSFQYTWLNCYFLGSLRDSRPNILYYYVALGTCEIVRNFIKQLSLSLRYLVSSDSALCYRDSIVTLSIPATIMEAVKTPKVMLRMSSQSRFLKSSEMNEI